MDCLSKITGMLLACSLLFSGPSLALGVNDIEEHYQNIKPQEKKSRDKIRFEKLSEIAKDASTISLALASELTLQRGDPLSSLQLYELLLVTTAKPEIAQRAMELALSLRQFDTAESIYDKWVEIEPEASFQQKRMRFEADVLTGKAEQAYQVIPELLANSEDMETRNIFLFTAQLALSNPNLAKTQQKMIHDQVLKFKDIQEAYVADTIFSAIAKKNGQAVKALDNLASIDDQMSPSTQTTLRLLLAHSPDILQQFFEKANIEKLSNIWQDLQVDVLIASGDSKKAYQIVQKRLDKNPSVELYTQAGYLAGMLEQPLDEILRFFEKAYALGNNQERSKVALYSAISGLYVNNTEQTKAWVQKIEHESHAYDKQMILAYLAVEEKQWVKVKESINIIEKLPSKVGYFFNDDDFNRVKVQYLAFNEDPLVSIQKLQDLLTKEKSKNDVDNSVVSNLIYQISMVYSERMAEHEKAVDYLQQYLKLNPDNIQSYNSLGYTMLFIPGKEKEGLAYIKKAYKKDPKSAAINDSMGWAYYLLGNNKKALKYLQYAYQSFKDAEVAAHLGEVLWVEGRHEEAKKIWREGYLKDKNHKILTETLKKYKIEF